MNNEYKNYSTNLHVPIKKIAKLARVNENEVYVILVLLVQLIFFSIISPYFLTATNISNVLYQVSAIGILAAGQCMVILTGGIDLSIGGIFTLSGWIMCYVIKNTGFTEGIIIGLIVGLTAGLINGFLISYIKLEPFIVTLGTMSVYGGIVYIISDSKAVSNLPGIMEKIDEYRFLNFIPSYLIMLIIVFVLGQLFLSYSKPGRMLYAIGSNELAAKYSGINTRFYKMLPYVITGLFSAVAVFIQSAHLLAIDANAGTNLNLDTITAVVIGGTALTGGKGSLIGTAAGIVLIGFLGNGLNLLGISSYWQRVVVGLILIAAVTMQRMEKTERI